MYADLIRYTVDTDGFYYPYESNEHAIYWNGRKHTAEEFYIIYADHIQIQFYEYPGDGIVKEVK